MNSNALRFITLSGATLCSLPVFAQVVDPNLQVRIETSLPPQEIKPRLPQIENVPVTRTEIVTTTRTVNLSPAEQKLRLNRVLAKKGIVFFSASSPSTVGRLLKKYSISSTKTETKKEKRQVTTYVPKVVPRTTTVAFSAQSQAMFDTNAVKSNLNRTSDWLFTNSGSFTVSVPVGALDTLDFQVGAADFRYAKLWSKNYDVLTSGATYTQVLGTMRGPNNLSSSGTTTVDAMSYALSSTTVFGAGFSPYQVEYFTPSISWGRSKIDMGGTICGPKGGEVYCASGSIVATGDYTFSDIASQENFSAKIQAGTTWQTSVQGLTATATGIAQGRIYTAFPGGREDLLLLGILRADYVVSQSVFLSGSIQVAQQFSTVRAVEWNGLSIFPALRVRLAF